MNPDNLLASHYYKTDRRAISRSKSSFDTSRNVSTIVLKNNISEKK